MSTTTPTNTAPRQSRRSFYALIAVLGVAAVVATAFWPRLVGVVLLAVVVADVVRHVVKGRRA